MQLVTLRKQEMYLRGFTCQWYFRPTPMALAISMLHTEYLVALMLALI